MVSYRESVNIEITSALVGSVSQRASELCHHRPFNKHDSTPRLIGSAVTKELFYVQKELIRWKHLYKHSVVRESLTVPAYTVIRVQPPVSDHLLSDGITLPWTGNSTEARCNNDFPSRSHLIVLSYVLLVGVHVVLKASLTGRVKLTLRGEFEFRALLKLDAKVL